MSRNEDTRIGSMRPSQLMWSYGVGAMIDLPRLSVMVGGLDQWDTNSSRQIVEERLLSAVQTELGHQVSQLLEPPLPEEETFGKSLGDPVYRIGVPVEVFPGWLRCPRCGQMSDFASGVFKFNGSSLRPDDASYRHDGCPKIGKGRPPSAVPARFVVACRAGHLDDFPWREYVHRGPSSCGGMLRFYEKGASLETANLFVACDNGLGFSTDDDHAGTTGGCGARPRSMVDAFGARGKESLPNCRGRHPHLRSTSNDCGQDLRTITLGSSSSWFPKTISALSIPTADNQIGQEIEDRWGDLKEAESVADIAVLRKFSILKRLSKFGDDEIFEAIEARRSATPTYVDTEDMKAPEWEVLSNPSEAPTGADFQVNMGDVPEGFAAYLEPTILVEKIREVNALVGFTRLEAPEELMRGEDELPCAPLSYQSPKWVPANEVRGEGLLIRFKADAISEWEHRAEVVSHLEKLRAGNSEWRAARSLDPSEGYSGNRHVLLHSFSHLLMRELALECGYSAASVRERIYAASPDLESDPDMCGILIYTAAPDSEGTLGGLVRLAEKRTLGRLIKQALQHSLLCAADPLCSEHDPSSDRTLHAAACHACTFAPETGCESGNRFLDRACVVPTLTESAAAFFGQF